MNTRNGWVLSRSRRLVTSKMEVSIASKVEDGEATSSARAGRRFEVMYKELCLFAVIGLASASIISVVLTL